MSKKLAPLLVGSLSSLLNISFGKELIIFIISLLPILESRGALIAASLLNLDLTKSLIISFIGNIIPIFAILFIFEKFYNLLLNSQIKFLYSFARFLNKKINKHKTTIEKYGFIGIFLFVAIPFPGTGVWTACMIATVLKMDKKHTTLASILGVLVSMIIMSLLSFGLLANIIK